MIVTTSNRIRQKTTMACDVSIIIVSYNTCELTCACIESVYAQTTIPFELLVVDNQSSDGSAEQIAARFPGATLITPDENLGFARANNLAAQRAIGDYLLLLNPDTVVLDRAIDRLVAFARQHPANGIYGGRTRFADGSLNPTSCWGRSTPFSEFAFATGLSAAFRRSGWLNPEEMGNWQRDSVREVDIVTGCFFLITRDLWQRLGGFHPDFFMYGEEADLCLRARQLGARPIITPDATIIHYGGRSEQQPARKMIRMLRVRRMLMQRHWPPAWVPFGRAMQCLTVWQRRCAFNLLALLGRRGARERAALFAEIWRRRAEWTDTTHVAATEQKPPQATTPAQPSAARSGETP